MSAQHSISVPSTISLDFMAGFSAVTSSSFVKWHKWHLATLIHPRRSQNMGQVDTKLDISQSSCLLTCIRYCGIMLELSFHPSPTEAYRINLGASRVSILE